MISNIRFKSLVGLALAVGLLWSLACGGAEEATPTPTATAAPEATTAAPGPAPTATPIPRDTSMDPKYGGIIQLTDLVRSLDIGTIAGNPGEYNQMQGWMSQAHPRQPERPQDN